MIQTILDSDERRKIWLYFLDLRKKYALFVFFLGLILVETQFGKMLLFLGLLWLGGALVLAMKRPSDQEIDELFSRELETLVQKALQSLRPPEHGIRAAPFALYGPADLDTWRFKRPFSRPRMGTEGNYRSPVNRATILVPMEGQLGIFSCQHDSIDGLTSQVSVEEPHYRDVVAVRWEENVAVSTIPKNPRDRGEAEAAKARNPTTQVLSLEFTNGRRFFVPVSVALQGSEGGAGRSQGGLDETVMALRVLMRDSA
jgi:hypothetical protein